MKSSLDLTRKLSPFAVRLSWFLVLILILPWLVGMGNAAAPVAQDDICPQGYICVNTPLDEKKGNDGLCSLREAIIAANTDKKEGGKPGECRAGNGPDTIVLPAGTYFLTRTDNGNEDASQTGDLDIIGDLTIIVEGPGATIDASGITDRVFHILSGSVTVTGVAIKNGGGNVDDGGGIYNAGTLTLTNATVSGNAATARGGGIYNSGTLALNNVTIADNTANNGGGISNDVGTVEFRNTIIADNGPNNCSGTLSSQGYNLDSDGTCVTDGVNNDITSATPWLGPLQNNGGKTETHALLLGSPAIDAGDDVTCLPIDQRGEVRPLDGDNDGQARCDIGAFELRYNNFVLIRAFPNDEGGTTIHGLLDGVTDSTVHLDFFSHIPICPADMSQSFDSAQVTTDENGYFTAQLAEAVPDPTTDPTASSFFLTATATDLDGSTLGLSNCVSVGGNTSWPLALSLDATFVNGTADIDQYLDKLGQSRWYKFKVEPNSEVVVTLTDLAANYDLTIYKDVKAAFLAFLVPTEDDLPVLNAQFAGDAFAGDAFAGDAFAGDAFAGDAFAGDAFAGDAFAGDAFAGDAFAGDAFAGDAFAGDAFAGDAFAGDAFAGDAFAGDAFAGDAFAGDAFAGDAFAGDAFAAAFSSAQMQSLIGISAFEGTTSEGIFVNTWNNTGEFYVRVRGRNGAFDPNDSFHLKVTVITGACSGINDNGFGDNTHTATAGDYSTIILTDLNRMDVEGPDEEAAFAALPGKLASLANAVDGVWVDVGGSDFERVINANIQADDNPNCPYAKNLVAQEIKDVIDDYRALNPLEYVVIIGDDDVIPFFRHPDNALLALESQYSPPVRNSTPSQASLKLDYVLSQDAYGSKFDLSLNNSTYPVPVLAVGRLVETAVEINAMLDAFDSSGGVVTPETSLATGYDFMADAAYLIRDELGEGTGNAPEWLITDGAPTVEPTGWTADDLRNALLPASGQAPDIAFLAGHFTTNAALAADYVSTMSASEVAESDADMTNSVIFSVGCHAGYNTVDDHGLNILDRDGNVIVTKQPDWAQAFAGKGATLVAGTGYQYGETDFLEYSERIYLEFIRQLRLESAPGPVSVGQALMEAKKLYLAQTPRITGLHEKALLEASIFGLPFMKVDLVRDYDPPAALELTPSLSAFSADPGLALELHYSDITVMPSLTENHPDPPLRNLDGTLVVPEASYLSGTPLGSNNGIATNLGEPALPLEVYDVTVLGTTLRGVGFRGGMYTEQNVIPLTGAPATEISNVHTPFLTNYLYPVQMWRVNYWDVLDNPNLGITHLMLTPAQHKISSIPTVPQQSTRRQFSRIDLRLYYSNNAENFPTPDPDDPSLTINSRPALSGAPTIIRVGADPDPDTGIVAFEALVTGNPAAGIQEVWVTYTACPVAGCNGQWVSFDLEQSPVHSTIWRGELDLNAAGIANAADIFYMVQAVNGVGLVSRVDNQGKFFVPGVTPAGTELQFVSVPTEGDFGTMATFSAHLTSNGANVPFQPVTFRLGTANKSGLGDVSGVALTGSDGIAEIHLPLRALPGDYQLRAFFDGTATLEPSLTIPGEPFTINKQGTILSLDPLFATVPPGEDPGIEATLTDDDTGRRLHARTVFFVVKDHDNPGSGPFYSVHTITNWRGVVSLGSVNLPAGVYDVNAYFNGTIDLDPTDPDPGTIVTLDDDGYEPAFASGRLTINTPPVANADGPYFGDEGDEITLYGSGSSDPDGHALTYAWDFGEGNIGSGITDTHTYSDNGEYVVTLTVTDTLGASDSQTTTATISNVAPTVEAGDDQAANEGDTVELATTFTDPGSADTHTATIDWGDGTPVEAGTVVEPTDTVSGTVSGSHAYGDDGSYTVTVTVTDDDGGSAQDTFFVTVVNVAPTVMPVNSSAYTGDETTPILVAEFTDPGFLDTHTAVIINWGDGTSSVGSVTEPTDTEPGKVYGTHSYAAPSMYTVTVQVCDDENACAQTSSSSVTVVDPPNQPPVADPGGPYSADEGAPITFDGTGSSDPDGDALTYAWDFGDGDTGSGSTVDHIYADDGQYIVTLTVTDPTGSGESNSQTTTATISNVAPTVNAGDNQAVSAGDPVNVSATFSDPGSADTHTATIDWGDGTVEPGTVDETTGTVSGSHAYLNDGSYTVTVTVTDDDGGSGDDTFTVTVVTAVSDPQTIWPPNGKMVLVGVIVTDPDVLMITIDSIFQDEPVGDEPDAIINLPDGTAYLRAERDGNGNGRVYHIFFTAYYEDNTNSSGEVKTAIVAHDQSDDIDSIDDGAIYNSTQPE
jgi:pentapeptide MXKDX repeat protein